MKPLDWVNSGFNAFRPNVSKTTAAKVGMCLWLVRGAPINPAQATQK